jgi:cellulose biosynthesis protein BcsQ
VAEVSRRRRRRRRVAIGNNKGGTGKTVATVNLAAAWAEAGRRVLVVDMDPQANASRRLGAAFDPAAPSVTVSEAIQSGAEGVAADAVRACGWSGLYGELIDVIPARFDLENRVSEAAVLGAVGRLRRALAGADDEHDVTLIDCPPSLGHLTQLALAAADVALCTVEPEYDGVEGAVRFRDFIATQAEELKNPELRLIGFLASRVRTNLGAHSFQLDGLAESFGADLVWTPHIPERAVVKDASDTAVPLRQLGGVGVTIADLYSAHAERLVKELAA